ncbi:MAG: SEL1-like repeat protein [Hyphomicrobiales bacterium]|nr:SEL1-like repeat protein [Hyphomicrobiales bacterium]
MKSGGPWNLRGLRPETRAAAREAARRSGLSVGEWLNSVIQPAGEDDEDWWGRDFDREPEFVHQPRPRYDDREPRPRYDDREPPHWRDWEHERERFREPPPPPPPPRRRARYDNESDDEPPVRRRARPVRDDYGPPGAPYRGEPPRPPRARRERPRHDEPPVEQRVEDRQDASIDRAVAEIAARQRALDDNAADEIKARQHALDDDMQPPRSFSEREPQPLPPRPESDYPTHYAGEPLDLSLLEQQLREITARIETLQPSGELHTAIAGLQNDLAAIGRSLNEALPRRALESLEIEIKALAQRIDHTRESGADGSALAGIEHGLIDVREALRTLTPAESLVGFQEAVNTLSQKVDAIVARDDPAALQQLEAAIGGLRGIVSHVASNDTLTKVAEDVRELATKVDNLALSGGNLPTLTALENRIETLAGAINASTAAGHAVPRELEKLLSGLIEKLEWVQLTHTDHTALAHLEDRIASLVKRLDVSDARLGLLEGVERGLADLLVYIEQLRNGGAGATVAPGIVPAAGRVEGIAESAGADHRSQAKLEDSLEAVQGTVEHVVDRLAMIESDMRGVKPGEAAAPRAATAAPEPVHLSAPPPEPLALSEADEALFAAEAAIPAGPPPPPPEPEPPPPPQQASLSQRLARARVPIDPNLPPDHPLEPGSGANRARVMPSAAERIAASEAAIGAKPPVIPDPGGGKSDFIAAARRAAKAAAVTAAEGKSRGSVDAGTAAPAKTWGEKLRTLAVAAAVVVIVVGGFHIVSRLFEDGGQSPPPHAKSEPPQQPEPKPIPVEPPHVQAEPQALPGAAPEENAPRAPTVAAPPATDTLQTLPAPKAGATPPSAPAHPDQQSSFVPPANDRAPAQADIAALVGSPGDVTGSLPKASAPWGAAGHVAGSGDEKLPIAIGGPMLRNAALAGDPLAAYAVAVRFADGRVVPTNDSEAARWFEVAAKKGLAPAQFRLGALYEKGLGVRKDLAAARDLYRSAAEKGHGKAMHNLAVLYAEGVNGKADYRTAAQWFRKAADRGITDSQYNLAVLYARGVGVEQNFADAYKWFALAAKDGDSDAAQKRDEIARRLDQDALAAARAAVAKWTAIPQPSDVIAVKDTWDAAGNGAPPARPRGHASAKRSTSGAAKVN